MSSSKMEEAIVELKSLAKIKPLKDAQLTRFKQLCSLLRKGGFTNSDISNLTGGAYSPVTIKEYTRGVKSASTSKRDEITSSLSKLIDQGDGVASIREFVDLKEQLARKGLTISSVSNFIKKLEISGIEIDDIQDIQSQLEALGGAGASTQQVAAFVQYADGLRRMGVQPTGVKGIYDAAKKYGAPAEKIIEAINAYENLLAIKKLTDAENAKMQQMRQTVKLAEDQLHVVETKKGQIQKEIDLISKLHELGFVDNDFVEMHQMSTKMGGPKQTLAALKEYSSIAQLDAKSKELQAQGDELTRRKEVLKHENMLLNETTSICRDLIFEHNFSEQAIMDVYQISKRYGNPAAVREALDKYGNIQGLDSQIKAQQTQIKQHEAAIRELETKQAELKGMISSLTSTLQQAQDSVIQRLQNQSISAVDEIRRASADSIAEVHEIMKKYGEMQAKAEAHKKELQFARIVLATELPGGIREVDPYIALVIIKALDRFCKEKGINQMVFLPQAI